MLASEGGWVLEEASHVVRKNLVGGLSRTVSVGISMSRLDRRGVGTHCN